jgi:hypothetical protein
MVVETGSKIVLGLKERLNRAYLDSRKNIKSIALLNSIASKLITLSSKDSVTLANSAESTYRYINRILKKDALYNFYLVNVNYIGSLTGECGIIQSEYMKNCSLKHIVEKLQSEEDTFVGVVNERYMADTPLLLIISQIEIEDFILKLIDDAVPVSFSPNIGHVTNNKDDQIASILGRVSLAMKLVGNADKKKTTCYLIEKTNKG